MPEEPTEFSGPVIDITGESLTIRESPEVSGALKTKTEVLPELKEGQEFTSQGKWFKVNQICGETAYIQMRGRNWDTPIPVIDVIRVIANNPQDLRPPEPSKPRRRKSSKNQSLRNSRKGLR